MGCVAPSPPGRGIHGLRKERAHLPAIRPESIPGDLMRPQHGKRIAVRTVEDGFEFLRSHAQLLWQRVVSRQELGTAFRDMKKAELHVHLEGSIGA